METTCNSGGERAESIEKIAKSERMLLQGKIDWLLTMIEQLRNGDELKRGQCIYPQGIYIGDGCTINKGVVILAHFYDTKVLTEHAYYRGCIKIGDRCYIGMNTIFTKPVVVGDGVVIGAGSIVTKDIPPYEVWAGVPAKFICKRYEDSSQIPSSENFKPR